MSTLNLQTASLAEHRGDALRRFGYTPEQAAFLALAALIGGYFLRRHVAVFLGTHDGGAVSKLVQRALDLEHIRCSTWANGMHLYHVGSRPFYEVLGEGDNRNRRRHELTEIKRRLMCLDFALARPNAILLATERERLAFFRELQIGAELLPQKCFQDRAGSRSTTRYFVDRQPILRDETADGAFSGLTFAFVDEGLVTLSRFERFLREHAPLFKALSAFALVYVADSARHFRAAVGMANMALDTASNLALPLDQREDARLLTYFELRRRFEKREFAAFNRDQLLQLRNLTDALHGPEIDALYERWRTSGDANLSANLAAGAAAQRATQKTFATDLLPYDYSHFQHFAAD